jgi:solute carrier family 25 phosphate transporter 23/24/25/41
MFMPVAEDGSHLHAVMSWYSSIVTITAEGDSVVSDDKLSKTGRRIDLLMRSLFGAVLAIIIPRAGPAHVPTNKISPPSVDLASGGADRASLKAPPADDSLPPSTASPQLTLPAFSLASPPPQPPPSSAPLLSTSVSSVGPALAPSLSIAPPVQPPSTPSSITSLLSASGHPPVEVDQESDADAPNDEFSSHADHPRATKKAKAKGLTAFIPDPGYFLAGAAAGGVSRTATAPLDRLKVYLLVNTQASPGATAAAAASSAVRAGAADAAVAAAKQGRLLVAARASFNPILHAVQDIYGSGGLRNFFAGNGLNVVKIMPETAIKFGTYEAAKRALASIEGHGDTHAINTYSKFAAGGVAGMVAQFSVYPLDTLKFRLQCETVKGGPKGNELLMATARRMFAEGVWRTSYRGVTMGLVGMFPYSAIDMWTFDFLKGAYARQLASWTGRHEEDAKPGNLATGIIGATSGAFGATVVYPLNVVRTRLQTQGTVMHRATYTGIVDATRKTIQNEGVRGLYKGLTPNLLKVAPALSITWVVYENAKKALQLD